MTLQLEREVSVGGLRRALAVSIQRFSLVLSAAVLAAGCIASPKPKAAQTLQCPEDQLDVKSNTAYSDVVTGCGKSDVIVLEGGGEFSSLRERAAFELSCADSELNIQILSTSLDGVTGCGKKMVYKYVPYVGIVADTAQGEVKP